MNASSAAVWTELKGTNWTIERGGKLIARYALREELYQDVPKGLL